MGATDLEKCTALLAEAYAPDRPVLLRPLGFDEGGRRTGQGYGLDYQDGELIVRATHDRGFYDADFAIAGDGATLYGLDDILTVGGQPPLTRESFGELLREVRRRRAFIVDVLKTKTPQIRTIWEEREAALRRGEPT